MLPTQADRDLIELVARLVRVARGFQQEQAFCEGITFTQFLILDQVVNADSGLALSDLHTSMEVDKSTTTRLVAPLLEAGLVAKHRREDDRRAFELRITDAGRATAGRVWTCIAGAAALVDGFIPAAEREGVYRGVKLFAQALKGACEAGCCQGAAKGGCCVIE